MGVGAPEGNTNAMKFKTSEERQALCQLYCEHMTKGLSKECFVPCDMDTFERYCRDFPIDFPAEKIKQAEREGRLHWEEMGDTMAVAGQGNATVWIFNMKNRFRWMDRHDHDITSGGQPINVNTINYGDHPAVQLPTQVVSATVTESN